MKKLMMIGSALLVLSSTSAFATQARLLALGMNETDNEGMYHISDSRNIFLNPAYINVYSDQAVFDWGSAGQYANIDTSKTSTATLSNNASAPKAQGGVFKKYGDFVYGLYFGNESNTSSLLRVAGTSAASAANAPGGFANRDSKMLQTADNQIDLFFGGDNGMKWAVNPTVAFGKDDGRESKDSAVAVRGGLMGSSWDAHLNLSLNSKSEATESVNPLNLGAVSVKQEFKGKLGFHVGGSYVLEGSNRIFGYVKHYGWEQSDSYNNYTALNAQTNARTGGNLNSVGGQNGTVKGDFTSYYLGWGRDFDVNDGDKLFASLAGKMTSINLKFTRKSEVKHMVVPLTLGYEAKAADWLTLRGSVVQNLYGTRDNKNVDNDHATTGSQLNPVARGLIKNIYGGTGKATIASSTAVNAGATLNFGQLSVDGLIGTTASTGTASSKKGILSASNLETSVGATYKF